MKIFYWYRDGLDFKSKTELEKEKTKWIVNCYSDWHWKSGHKGFTKVVIISSCVRLKLL
jgi:hypothetical protein